MTVTLRQVFFDDFDDGSLGSVWRTRTASGGGKPGATISESGTEVKLDVLSTGEHAWTQFQVQPVIMNIVPELDIPEFTSEGWALDSFPGMWEARCTSGINGGGDAGNCAGIFCRGFGSYNDFHRMGHSTGFSKIRWQKANLPTAPTVIDARNGGPPGAGSAAFIEQMYYVPPGWTGSVEFPSPSGSGSFTVARGYITVWMSFDNGTTWYQMPGTQTSAINFTPIAIGIYTNVSWCNDPLDDTTYDWFRYSIAEEGAPSSGTIYYCSQPEPNGFYKVKISDDATPVSTVSNKRSTGAATNYAHFGIWAFGDQPPRDVWIAGQGHATAGSSATLRRSVNDGLVWTNEYARMPGTPPEQSTFGPIYGRGDTSPGNLWIGGSAAFSTYRIIRAPDPLNGNPFTSELASTPPPFAYIHGAESPTRIWTVINNPPTGLGIAHYFDGTSWTASNMSGVVHRPPATQIGSIFGIWVDGPRNKVYLLAHDNNTPNHAYIFSKAADQPTAAWTEDAYLGAIYTTGPSASAYTPRYLHGCQRTGALYFFYSGLGNKGTLQRRDPSTGIWSIVKTMAFSSGGNRDLWVIDDDHLLAWPLFKTTEGYFEYNVDVPALPSSSQPMAVWGVPIPDEDPPVLSNEDPAPGEQNVSKTKPIEFDLTDSGSGLDDNLTALRVNGVLVWQSNSAVNGWLVTLTAIAGGWHFTLTPPVPYTTPVVVVGVYAEDQVGNVLDTSYPFYPSVDLALTVSILAQRFIRVEFGQRIAATLQALEPSNYTLDDEITVQRVLYDASAPALDHVDLFLSKTIHGQRYQLTVSNLQFAESGSYMGRTSIEFEAQTTKVDYMTARLGRIYDTAITSNMFQVLAAMGISDTTIGGELIQFTSSIAEEIEAEVEEEEEMQLPRLVWTDATTITISTAPGEPQPFRVRLQDGNFYTLSGLVTFDPSASGLGGLDTGSEAASTWYYLYLVPSGTNLNVVGSANDPDTGPVGYPNYRYISAVLNDSSSDLLRFHQVSNDEFHWDECESAMEPATIAALSKSALHTPAAAYDIGDTVPPVVASAVYVEAHIQRNSVGGWALFIELSVSGAIDTTTTTGYGDPRHFTVRAQTNLSNNYNSGSIICWLPLPPGTGHPEIGMKVDRDGGTVAPNNFFVRVAGWKDGYR